jgi:hypothetical protein
MIQVIYEGVEIELESHQAGHGLWRCNFTLITHPDRARTLHQGEEKFPTKDLADESALQEAHKAVDQLTQGKPQQEITDSPRQVRV